MRNAVSHIHFVGICGGGMSAIALLLRNQGFTVTGSDLNAAPVLNNLHQAGIDCYLNHDANNIEGCHLLVYSSAIKKDNVEIEAAKKARIPILSRADMLGELMRFSKSITISGTHGKTTTSSMVGAILMHAGLDPTIIIGAPVPFLSAELNANAHLGKGPYMVAEVDESDRSFIHVHPWIALVTNIDNDHLASYQGEMEVLYQSFVDFLHNLPFYGTAIVCIDDAGVRNILGRLQRQVLTYGTHPSASIQITEIKPSNMGTEFTVISDSYEPLKVHLPTPGQHNVANACGAIAVARKIGVPDVKIIEALASFESPMRRFQIMGKWRFGHIETLVVSDYAHHPTELEATLKAADQTWPQRRKVVIFQPHRYTRTGELLDRFAQVLRSCEVLMICDVYAAGESPLEGSDAQELCRAIRIHGLAEPIYIGGIENVQENIKQQCKDQDVLFLLGAGDIHLAAERLVEKDAQ